MNIDYSVITQPVVLGAIITSLLGAGIAGSFFTHYFTNVRSDRELKRTQRTKRLEYIYEPIVKVILSQIHPGDGYDGIVDSQFNAIEAILKEHTRYADDKLEMFINSFAEDQYHFSMSHVQWPSYDSDAKFLKYVFKEYNNLRKKLHLPYRRNNFLKEGFVYRYRQFRRFLRRKKRFEFKNSVK